MDEMVNKLEAADIAAVLKMLPHRYPFLMVDRVIDIHGDERGIGIKNVTFNEPHFQGHFPDNPVFPGVLLIEGMAQTAGVLCIVSIGIRAAAGVLLDHRQGEVSQAGGAGRHHRISHDEDHAPPHDVVVSWRRKSRRSNRRRGECRRHNFRRMSAPSIDASARIEDGAKIGRDVTIGPYCTIGAHVTVGDGCKLLAHVNLTGHTTIGARTVIHPFASLGSPPQSAKYRGGPTRLVVGVECDIRENVTMNTGTEDDSGLTQVGDKCFLMGGSHVGHDCKVGNNVTVANNVVLGGHVSVGDNVVFGGVAAVRQFVRIGDGAMVVGLTGLRADVIPWGMVRSAPAVLVGLNVVGMRRHGLTKADIHRVRAVYLALFFGDGEFRARLDRLAAEHGEDAQVMAMLGFIRVGKRPLTMAIKNSEIEEQP